MVARSTIPKVTPLVLSVPTWALNARSAHLLLGDLTVLPRHYSCIDTNQVEK